MESTDAEKRLWRLLRDRRFSEFKFRRQYPCGIYFLDFYCTLAKLAVELDGGGHGFPDQRARDEKRNQFLAEQGIKVLRFWNHQLRGELAAIAAVFTIIGLTWGKGAFESSWKSHTTAQVVPGFDRAEDHKFEPRLLSNHIECAIAAAACIMVALWQKRVREVAFPVVLLLTASIIHTIHRPWWNCYYLHLAIPLAWLAGWFVNELIQGIFRLHAKKRFDLSSRATWKMLGLCALVALAIARSERRLEGTVKYLRQRPLIEGNLIVKKMKEYASRTKWVYSESGIYPFHAKLVVPPELAIIMPKRFWSGQITTKEIVETCKRYQPELLVLPMTGNKDEWKGLLDSEYVLTSIDKKSVLYVAKRVTEGNAP